MSGSDQQAATCQACGHPWPRHTSGGMCTGEPPDGSECYCVLFPPKTRSAANTRRSLDFEKTQMQQTGTFSTIGLTLAQVCEVVTDVGLSLHDFEVAQGVIVQVRR